jgi:prepilin peptidase CpaA
VRAGQGGVVISFAPSTSPLWAVALAGLLVAAVVDFRHRIIPDRVVLLIAACGIAIQLLSQDKTLVLSIFLAVAILLVFGVLARRELIGGGDAKLIAAVTLMFRPTEIAALFLVIALSGGLLSVMYVVTRCLAPAIGPPVPAPSFPEPHARMVRFTLEESIPYGVAIFAGTACVLGIKALRWLHATS